MSYDIKLSNFCNHKVIEEDHILESDNVTVVLDRFVTNSNLNVRINDFERPADFQTEIVTREIVTKFSVLSFHTNYSPIYDGLKIGNAAQFKTDVVVKNKVEQENLTAQVTGHTKLFNLANQYLLKANNFDFNTLVTTEDLEILIKDLNNIDVTSDFIIADIDAIDGIISIQNKNNLYIPAGFQLYITYFFRMNITLDALNGQITLLNAPYTYSINNELVASAQLAQFPVIQGALFLYENNILLTENVDYKINYATGSIAFKNDITGTITANYNYGLITIQYFRRLSDGWTLQLSSKSLIPGARDIVFSLPKKTNRIFVTREDVSDQFSNEKIGTLVYTSTAGGETRFQMHDRFIVEDTEKVFVDDIELDATEYSIDYIRGILLLNTGLIIGQIINITYLYKAVDKLSFTTKFTPLVPLFQSFYDLKGSIVLNNAVAVAKVYDVENERLNRGKTGYQTNFYPVLEGSYQIYKNTNLLVENQDYTINATAGMINFLFIISQLDILTITYQYGVLIPVRSVNAQTGQIDLFDYPKVTDKIEVSYYYQNDVVVDRISVDYLVPPDQCDKCVTHSSLIDYRTDGVGNYFKIYNEQKLIQDVVKMTETILGSDPVAAWYGMTLINMIGSQFFPEYVTTKISSQILNALSNLKTAQIQQSDYQEVTPNEALDFIKDLTVTQDTSDPTFYKAVADLVTKAGNSIDAAMNLTTQSNVT